MIEERKKGRKVEKGGIMIEERKKGRKVEREGGKEE